MITGNEIRKKIEWLFLALAGFYLFFPVKIIIDNLIFKEAIPENTFGKLIVGIIMGIVSMALLEDN